EWKNNPFERRRITDPIWSPNELGPQRPFVREQLMHIKKEPMLPPRPSFSWKGVHWE
ncbi:16019_t:CDS:2, partial [Gigaspora margarita]